MPGQARLDAPGTLNHIIVGGIERREIVDDDKDRGILLIGWGQLHLKRTQQLTPGLY